jgi:hypothetical protein
LHRSGRMQWVGDGAVTDWNLVTLYCTVPCSLVSYNHGSLPTFHSLLGRCKGGFQNPSKHIIPEDGKWKCLPKFWKTFNLLSSIFTKPEVLHLFSLFRH